VRIDRTRILACLIASVRCSSIARQQIRIVQLGFEVLLLAFEIMDVISGILLLGHGINNNTRGGGLDAGTALRRSMVATYLAQATLLACRDLLWLFAHTYCCAGWSALLCMLRTSCRCCGTGGEDISAIEARRSTENIAWHAWQTEPLHARM
jgi:hypothetical protein